MLYSTANDMRGATSEACSNTHELKTQPDYFNAVSEGRKKFELRRNDRNFKIGDQIMLREWTESGYTGRNINCKVDYILEGYDGLDPDYVILSITVL
jgi:hypothetical protein